MIIPLFPYARGPFLGLSQWTLSWAAFIPLEALVGGTGFCRIAFMEGSFTSLVPSSQLVTFFCASFVYVGAQEVLKGFLQEMKGSLRIPSGLLKASSMNR